MSDCAHIELQLWTAGSATEPTTFDGATVTSSLLLPVGATTTIKGKTGEIAFTGSTTIAELLTAALALAKS
jgi:hypothetical protein